ncbi:hypothetical protein [Shouchella lehensis]|uniref:Uncharacterized protein n=1 Tax=Shouchella lehensis TaxID=300825 RepID=A0A4Y7WR98_9BACI|nr:hypothetical protein [Shouchella lehensis]MBG9784100.1 hypothetical protein [Shouchella lehensis]TES50917.1 hypothetical protein E2L03_03070 [Shouchella lehensis]
MTQSTSRLTPVQLHQRLIHAESEIVRLNKELERYKNDYHYNMIDELLAENKELLDECSRLKEQAPMNENQSQKTSSQTESMESTATVEKKQDEQKDEQQPSQSHDESVFFSSKANLPNQPDSLEDNSQASWFTRSIKARSKK